MELGADVDGPVVLRTFPNQEGTLAGDDLRAVWVYTSDGQSVKSVSVTDGLGNNVTSMIKLRPSGVELPVSLAAHGRQDYTLALDDRLHQLSFFVDAVPPVTTVSHDSGVYAVRSFPFQWSCDEDVTLHYSVDGDAPMAGAENTHTVQIAAGQSVAKEITEDTVIRWYSVDAAKNREAERKRVFLLRKLTSETPPMTVKWASSAVRVSWPASPDSSQIQIYRATNARDIALLEASRAGAYPPPSALRIARVSAPANRFDDPKRYFGAQVSYGITAVKDGKESVLSPLQSVDIPKREQIVVPDDPEQARRQAIQLAALWLQTRQNDNGSWGRKRAMVATAQVLDGLHAANVDSRMGRRGLAYLRSRKVGDNDSLARVINTLERYGQDVEARRVRLLANAKFDGTKVVGWGVDNHYHPDPVTTALGLRATGAPLANAWVLAVEWPGDNDRPGWTRCGVVAVDSNARGVEVVSPRGLCRPLGTHRRSHQWSRNC